MLQLLILFFILLAVFFLIGPALILQFVLGLFGVFILLVLTILGFVILKLRNTKFNFDAFYKFKQKSSKKNSFSKNYTEEGYEIFPPKKDGTKTDSTNKES